MVIPARDAKRQPTPPPPPAPEDADLRPRHNAVVWWNSLYIDAAVTRLRTDGFPATEQRCARLSPLGFDHINFLGSYTFPTDPTVEDLRPLRDPHG